MCILSIDLSVGGSTAKLVLNAVILAISIFGFCGAVNEDARYLQLVITYNQHTHMAHRFSLLICVMHCLYVHTYTYTYI